MPRATASSDVRRAGKSSWSCVWSTAQCVLVAATLLMGFALFVPMDQIDSAADNRLLSRRSAVEHGGIRAMSLAGDHEHFWVIRYPAVVQRVSLHSGKVVDQKVIPQSFPGGFHFTAASGGGVVYYTEEATYLSPIPSRDASVKLFNFRNEWNTTSPMHDIIALCRDCIVETWSLTSGRPLCTKTFDCRVTRLQWSPDGCHLLALLSDGGLHILSAETLSIEQSQATGMQGGGNVTWAENGEHVAVFSSMGRVFVWDCKRELAHSVSVEPAFIYACALSPDGSCLAVPGHNNQIWLFDRDEITPPTPLGTTTSRISALCFSADGRQLLVGGVDGRIDCWSLSEGTLQWSLENSDGNGESQLPDREASSRQAMEGRSRQRGVS